MQKYFIIFVVLFFLVLGSYQLIRLKTRGRTSYPVFKSKNLEGKIIEVKNRDGLTFFRLDNGVQYSFIPVSVELNKNTLFDKIAEPGDSIIKRSFNDTIILIHKGVKFRYTSYEF
jgi:hypothetical protein